MTSRCKMVRFGSVAAKELKSSCHDGETYDSLNGGDGESAAGLNGVSSVPPQSSYQPHVLPIFSYGQYFWQSPRTWILCALWQGPQYTPIQNPMSILHMALLLCNIDGSSYRHQNSATADVGRKLNSGRPSRRDHVGEGSWPGPRLSSKPRVWTC